MAVSVEYQIGISPEYANVPVVYRVISLDGAQISKEYAKLEEIVSNSELQEEYFSLVKEHFKTKTVEAFEVSSLSELNGSDLFDLRDCLVYLMQVLYNTLNALPATESEE
jgi:uncharacterized tellurite resistance protein B-like protein